MQRTPSIPRLLPRWISALVAFVSLSACGASHSDKAFHLMVVSLGHLDSADLDHLDPSRHKNLVQFLATSTRYSNYRAMGSDDLGNMASMLTGLKPSEHGAVGVEDRRIPLSIQHTTLPRYLIEHNYNPGAVVPADACFDPKFGLREGFREYESIPGQAADLAALGVDWIEHHTKQPFFFLVDFPASTDGAAPDLERLDEALGTLLRCMGAKGLWNQSLIVVTATSPRSLDGDLLVPLCIKAPLQTQAQVDARELEQVHLPALILQHAALPVAAVRPAAYLTHPVPMIESRTESRE